MMFDVSLDEGNIKLHHYIKGLIHQLKGLVVYIENTENVEI